MGNRSEKTKEIFITLSLAFLCIVPFILAPLKNWYIHLTLFDTPIIFISIFRLLSDESESNSSLWNTSYIFIGFLFPSRQRQFSTLTTTHGLIFCCIQLGLGG